MFEKGEMSMSIRKTGVKSIGIRCPIIREGDDLVKMQLNQF